jgi:superfamily II DNA/RNA helicase
MQHFNELQLQEPIAKALQAMKFEKPTPIQAQAIPMGLDRKDIIACAQTGTGKGDLVGATYHYIILEVQKAVLSQSAILP